MDYFYLIRCNCPMQRCLLSFISRAIKQQITQIFTFFFYEMKDFRVPGRASIVEQRILTLASLLIFRFNWTFRITIATAWWLFNYIFSLIFTLAFFVSIVERLFPKRFDLVVFFCERVNLLLKDFIKHLENLESFIWDCQLEASIKFKFIL